MSSFQEQQKIVEHEKKKKYGPCTGRETINRNCFWENLDIGLISPRLHVNYFKYAQKGKENYENNVSPNREYQ